VALAAGAVVVGIGAAVEPALIVAAVVGLALAPIVLTRPIFGLAALVYLSFLETVSGLTGALSLTKILGAMLALAWIAAVAIRSSGRHAGVLAREPVLATALVLFIAWAAISLEWAEAQDAALTSVQRFALNFILFPIAFVVVTRRSHVLWLVGVFVAGAFTSAAFGLVQGTATDPSATERLGGAGINTNQLGSYLVVAAVFAAVLTANRAWSPRARLALAGVACLAALCVFLTVSRGALVGMLVAMLVAPFVIGRARRGAAVAAIVLGLAGSVAYFAVVAPANAVERVTSPDRDGGSGREDLWRVGWRMAEDKPVHGVGAGNYPERAAEYLLRPGATDNDTIIVDEKKVAHNVYLTVLSELGAVGLALFLSVIALCVRAAWRAAGIFALRGDTTMELVSRALVLGLASLLAVAFFSSAVYVKQFWILLALAPVLRLLAELGEVGGVTRWRERARAGG
jgi:putative inorganic carbon (hco3(-)) transporter